MLCFTSCRIGAALEKLSSLKVTSYKFYSYSININAELSTNIIILSIIKSCAVGSSIVFARPSLTAVTAELISSHFSCRCLQRLNSISCSLWRCSDSICCRKRVSQTIIKDTISWVIVKLLFLIPSPLINLTLTQTNSLREIAYMLFRPVRVSSELLNQLLDLAFILSDSVLVSLSFAQ